MRIVVLIVMMTALVGCGGSTPAPSPRTFTEKVAPPVPLPVAPMPREKEVSCTCTYCSCTQKPIEGFPVHDCVCNEERCKKNNCNCDKWQKK